MSFYQVGHLIAVLLTGLVAGLFYSYACSVTGGLGKLSDKEYLAAFQAINKAILNPWFFASFMGCLLVLPLTSWLSYSAGGNTPFYFQLSATLVYFIGVFGVTIFANVPLNNAVGNFNIGTASVKEIFAQRELFEAPWNKYNMIRTVAAILSFLLAILSILTIE